MVQEVPGRNAVQLFNDQALRGGPLVTPSIEGIVAGHWCLGYSHMRLLCEHVSGKLVL